MSSNRLSQAGLVLLVVILVITGSYIRTRPVDESETLDWLVIMQLVVCIAAGAVGLLLIREHSLGGPGGRRLIVYLLAVLASAVFSSYTTLVLGYWILLAGTSLLCIGLVASSPTAASLRRLEFAILVTLSFIVVKDTIINLLFIEPSETDQLYRLGEGATNANSLGLTAALAFCMSPPQPRRSGRGSSSAFPSSAEAGSLLLSIWWVALRVLFVGVIVMSRSRGALIAIILASLVRMWFQKRQTSELRSHILLAAIPCWVAAIVVFAAMSWTIDLPGATRVMDFVNRGGDADEVLSVTGRTEIWPYAIERIFEGKISLIFGHGYGASKEVLNENNWKASFFAYHAHNTFLELLLAVGLLGTVPFLLLISHSLKWLTRFFDMCRSFSTPFTLRAIAVIIAILATTMTEADLAIKIGPAVIVFMFYMLAVDYQERSECKPGRAQQSNEGSYAP